MGNFCGRCQALVQDGQLYCPECGAEINWGNDYPAPSPVDAQTGEMPSHPQALYQQQQSLPVQNYCKNCRSPVYPEQKRCPECLAKLPWKKATKKNPARLDYSGTGKYGQDITWYPVLVIIVIVLLVVAIQTGIKSCSSEPASLMDNNGSGVQSGESVLAGEYYYTDDNWHFSAQFQPSQQKQHGLI
ncbi:MAG: hypothetical protein FWD27_02055 [Coriobacteriia bacterium]|nr:hypothetical protein [Coriobacteriia bacterium]